MGVGRACSRPKTIGFGAMDSLAGPMDIDFPRMRKARRARLRDAMAAQGFDAVVLLGPSNQEYAGVGQPCADAMRMHYESVVVVVDASGDAPHVWTPFPEGVPDDVPSDQLHGPLAVEF